MTKPEPSGLWASQLCPECRPHVEPLVEAELAQLRAKIAAHESDNKKMFPIMKGPSVPWEVMAPHQTMAYANHSQTLERLAERGGLSPGEAWAVVNGYKYSGLENKTVWDAQAKKWFEFAERINLHYAELARLKAEIAAHESDHRILGDEEVEYRNKVNAELETLRAVTKLGTIKMEYRDGPPNMDKIARVVNRICADNELHDVCNMFVGMARSIPNLKEQL